ncbi:MAG: AGE family epimerase/isomerase, partial [Propionibacteriaceae bacterium]|nr:AGE family epimerase/isomerase [Propionibacteriaceae bacterium]
MTAPIATWGEPAHLAWLDAHRADLLAFYAPHVRRAEGGFHWLDNAGRPVPAQGQQLWIGARMVHVFSIAHLLGDEGAAEIARHGIDYYTTGAGRDAEHGGWFNAVMPDRVDDRKELYGHAHVLLAGSSAAQAGLPGGEQLAREASELIDRHFWV